jgi:hypothetical protein
MEETAFRYESSYEYIENQPQAVNKERSFRFVV